MNTKGGSTNAPKRSKSDRYTAKEVGMAADDLCSRYGLPARYREMVGRLCGDFRVSGFWDWYRTTAAHDSLGLASGRGLAMQLWHSTKLPKKPGNMTPAKRKAYFSQVREHALALQSLLRDTCFDSHVSDEISDSELALPLSTVLDNYEWESDLPIFITFEIGNGQRRNHGEHFAEYNFTRAIDGVIAWTEEEDHWDGQVFSTSAPIAQADSPRTRTIYFTCTMHEWFESKGLRIPFPALAAVVNVALALPADREVDEESVRKQIKRYKDKRT